MKEFSHESHESTRMNGLVSFVQIRVIRGHNRRQAKARKHTEVKQMRTPIGSAGNEACGMKEAAIVCSHIANGTHPVLQAVRMPRTEDTDSGWQFLCNSGQEEDPAVAEVWAIEEALKFEPTLTDWIEYPFGTTLWRPSVTEPWQEWTG